MKIEKYFWSFNKKALKEVKKVLKNPEHPKFVSYAFTLLSQCDVPKEVFSVIKKEHFIEYWPEIRKYWNKTAEAVDFKIWWDTIYYSLLQKGKIQQIEAIPMSTFTEIGKIIKKTRLIEKGKVNLTLETLTKIEKVLGIDKIELKFS